MKNNLTINKLAFSNLKKRKKNYIVLMTGIILAMIFVCSMLLFFFSSRDAKQAEYHDNYGKQDVIYSLNSDTDELYQDAKSAGLLNDYGIAHLIGYGYSDGKDGSGFEIGWLDDKARQYSNISFLKGSYPEKENEIAIENTAMKILDIDASVGDTITLNFKIQDGKDFYKTISKVYVLCGIVKDKRSIISNTYPEVDEFMPAGFVMQNTKVDLGGKERLTAYVNLFSSNVVNTEILDSKKRVLDDFFYSKITDLQYFSYDYNSYATSFNVLTDNTYAFILIAALVVAACVSIINAFNANLNDRKKQIGMLRAVGTTRRQIINIFGREALIISVISIPVSIALSYLLVWLIFRLTNSKLSLSASLTIIPISAVSGLIVVMLSALIPLIKASRITPMQAIRNIEKTRKMKTKKIKTQKNFKVSSILAKRSTAFSKSAIVSTSLILVLTISFSCLGFSYISYERANPYGYEWDYRLSTASYLGSGSVNLEEGDNDGLDDVAYQDIASIPYISKVYGEKSIKANIQFDEKNDYFKALAFNSYYFDSCIQKQNQITYDNFYNIVFENPDSNYDEDKALIKEDKDFIRLDMDSYDDSVIEGLKKYDYKGEINIDKLISGEEIILLAPDRIKFTIAIGKRGSFSDHNVFDDESVYKEYRDYTPIFEAECPFKVGDIVNITVAECNDEFELAEKKVNLNKKQVRIGAIISPAELTKNSERTVATGSGFGILTVNQGMNLFKSNAKYKSMNLDAETEVDENIEKTIKPYLDEYVLKTSGYMISNYEEQQRQINDMNALYYSLFALIIICFVICVSIINNTLSARIRESKKEIGTIRAFGADEKELVMSYFKQMLSMLYWGVGLGFLLFTAGFFAVDINNKVNGENIDLIYNPYITLILCAVMLAVCTINLWFKVRKEMKNSIIENIREL
ncbi:MAG: ABC transporter permease [Acetobacter sp.]|nr:ABC transporter permease [Bacteroides sp.]MCM1341544.1 ABC transporter permease [Acetobacter sp.]MCM1433621.1 ABC transporter permease [Clostridiales bacterium]